MADATQGVRKPDMPPWAYAMFGPESLWWQEVLRDYAYAEVFAKAEERASDAEIEDRNSRFDRGVGRSDGPAAEVSKTRVELVDARAFLERLIEKRGRPKNVPKERVLEAASANFLAIQRFLRPREGTTLELSEVGDLMVMTHWTQYAMYWTRRAHKTDVKQLELELLNGDPPLTFCRGTSKLVRMFGQPKRTLAPGCGMVFRDIERFSGGRVLWQRWCPLHQEVDTGRRLPAHVKRAIKESS